MIMCHNNFQLLQKLIVLLDNDQNDIYLHIDKKSRGFDYREINSWVKYANITFLKRINVNWGGYSQIKAELKLLKEATKKEHVYYHLLSGVDLPLKTQAQIQQFFEKNAGKEFVAIDEVNTKDNDFFDRIGRYHFFQDYIGRNKGYRSAFLEHLESISLNLQAIFHIKRNNKKYRHIYKGANWFSITHKFAKYLVANEKNIHRDFGFGLCADELFLQTIIMNSPFRNNIANDSLRYIDWIRGKPYIFKSEDYDILMLSNKLFARKFDYNKNSDIVDRIFDELHLNEILRKYIKKFKMKI